MTRLNSLRSRPPRRGQEARTTGSQPVDEWNPRGWHFPGFNGRTPPDLSQWARNDDNPTYTMADAILRAAFLDSCLRHCRTVAMTNLSPLVNTRGPIFTHAGGIMLRPTYHVCDLCRSLPPEVLDASVPSFALAGPWLAPEVPRPPRGRVLGRALAPDLAAAVEHVDAAPRPAAIAAARGTQPVGSLPDRAELPARPLARPAGAPGMAAQRHEVPDADQDHNNDKNPHA